MMSGVGPLELIIPKGRLALTVEGLLCPVRNTPGLAVPVYRSSGDASFYIRLRLPNSVGLSENPSSAMEHNTAVSSFAQSKNSSSSNSQNAETWQEDTIQKLFYEGTESTIKAGPISSKRTAFLRLPALPSDDLIPNPMFAWEFDPENHQLGAILPNGGPFFGTAMQLRETLSDFDFAQTDFPFFVLSASFATEDVSLMLAALEIPDVVAALSTGILAPPKFAYDIKFGRLVDGSGWTDLRVNALKTMWGAGYSATHIAKALTGLTRNAVIGKVHRLGLSNRMRSADAAPIGRSISGEASISVKLSSSGKTKTAGSSEPRFVTETGIDGSSVFDSIKSTEKRSDSQNE